MIRVGNPPVPQDFDERVKTPGMAFLRQYPEPTSALWKMHRYWRHAHEDLYGALGGICSYCASFTPRRSDDSGVDHTSIDHFIPKSKNQALAYEWDNFRLCRSRLNHRKGNSDDVIDPYIVENGKFRLNFANFLITPGNNLPNSESELIENSIKRLALNDDEYYVNERARVVYSYASGTMGFSVIERFYPFIAMEMASQNFDEIHMPVFKRALANENVRRALLQQGLLDE